MMQMNVERHEKFNRTKEPCGQSFKNCIDKFLDQEVGCRLHEEKTSQTPRCSSKEKIKTIEGIYKKFIFNKNEEFQRMTGCLPPCSYMKYSVVFTQKVSENLGFILKYAVKDLTVVKEVGSCHLTTFQELLYPFPSFLAEVGGALGLFLGFSFVMLWDVFFVIYGCFFKSSNFK